MGLPLGDDVMLNYESSSFHDNAAIRDLLRLKPTPEFETWMEKKGLTKDQAKAVAKDYGDAELQGLRRAIGAVGIFALLAFWFTRNLPGRGPPAKPA